MLDAHNSLNENNGGCDLHARQCHQQHPLRKAAVSQIRYGYLQPVELASSHFWFDFRSGRWHGNGDPHSLSPITKHIECFCCAVGQIDTPLNIHLGQERTEICCSMVGCSHALGLFVRRVWSLAPMLRAYHVPIESTHFEVR